MTNRADAKQCSQPGCEETDNLVGIGTSGASPAAYYCLKHFDVALRRVAAFIKRSWNAND